MSLPLSSPSLPSAIARQPVPAHQAVAAKQANETSSPDPVGQKQPGQKSDGEFSFLDFLDFVNPLQHIPVVNSIYRELTGDKINAAARIVGGALFGGPIGAILGGANAIVASETGKDVGQLAMNKMGLGAGDETKDVVKDAVKKDEKLPVVEVRPLAHSAAAKPIADMPFAVISARDIIWDDVRIADKPTAPSFDVAMNAALPEAKTLNDLKPVAGFDAAFDDAASLNAIEPGADDVQTAEKGAVDVPVDVPAAPIDADQIPNHMMQALSKYQAMQSVGDKAVIASNDAAKPNVSPAPFAGLGSNIRRYSY